MPHSSTGPRQPRSASGRFVRGSSEVVNGSSDTAMAQPDEAEPGSAQAESGAAHAETATAHTESGAAQAETGEEPLENRSVQAVPQEEARFHIFVIDTGWNSAASKVLHENFALVRDLNRADPVYLLDRDMSVAVLRQHSSHIGRDPIISVHDASTIRQGGTDRVHGFRLHLGLLRSEEKALTALQ